MPPTHTITHTQRCSWVSCLHKTSLDSLDFSTHLSKNSHVTFLSVRNRILLECLPSRQTGGYQPRLFVSSTYWQYPTDLLKTPTGSCPQHSPCGRKIHRTFPPSKQQAIIQDRAVCFLLSNPPWKEFKHLSPLELHFQQENYLFTHQVSNQGAVCISNKFTGTDLNIV